MEVAYQLGEEITKRWHTLVYGGGSRGLMWAVAAGIINQWWHAIGIIPKFLEKKEREGQSFTESEVIYVDSMDESGFLSVGDIEILIVREDIESLLNRMEL